MKIQNIVVAVVALLSVSVAVAQEADSVNVAQDSLKRDSVARVEYQPVRSVPTLGKVSVIDTLPTENKSTATTRDGVAASLQQALPGEGAPQLPQNNHVGSLVGMDSVGGKVAGVAAGQGLVEGGL